MIDSPLAVALCFGTYPPERNGGADFIANLARELVAGGTRVIVVTSPADAPPEEEVEPRLLVYREIDDWALAGAGWRSLRRANRFLKAEGVQVVHVFFPDSVLQERYQLPAFLGAGELPLVTTFWNLGLGRRSKAAIRFEALALLARSKVLTSHDPRYLRTLGRLAGWAKPVSWLPVGNNIRSELRSYPPLHDLRRSLGFETTARYLAYFGQLDATRGAEDLFEAVVQLRAELDVRLLMVGSAGRPRRYAQGGAETWNEFRRLRSLPDELGIGGAVTWTDYLGDDEVAAILKAADCAVLPYRRNSIGRSALATMLELGLPTVLGGSESSIAPLKPGRHVLVAPPGEPAILADVIRCVLTDTEVHARLAAGALAASRLFSWPRVAAAASDCYRRALLR